MKNYYKYTTHQNGGLNEWIWMKSDVCHTILLPTLWRFTVVPSQFPNFLNFDLWQFFYSKKDWIVCSTLLYHSSYSPT